jgi:hypothetical protein
MSRAVFCCSELAMYVRKAVPSCDGGGIDGVHECRGDGFAESVWIWLRDAGPRDPVRPRALKNDVVFVCAGADSVAAVASCTEFVDAAKIPCCHPGPFAPCGAKLTEIKSG